MYIYIYKYTGWAITVQYKECKRDNRDGHWIIPT